MATLEEAKQFMSMEDEAGQSLYAHLSDVILQILVDKPKDARRDFEHISAAVKEQAFAAPSPADLVDGVKKTAEPAGAEKQLAWAQAAAALYAVPDEPAEGGPALPDLMDLARMFELAGVSFGAEETFRLALSLKTLAEKNADAGYESFRFWGRVETRAGYFYVAEAPTVDEIEIEDAAKMEGAEGANKYTYFVTPSSSADWTKLPHVNAAQLVVAQKLRRYLTGDLAAKVPGYPPFEGTEAHYLRAQIGRITAECGVSPAGFYEADEDAGLEPAPAKIKDAEGLAEAPPTMGEELRSLDGWVRHEMLITAIGRCRALPEPEEDENGEVPELEQPEIKEPLSALADDEEGSWVLRTAPGGAAATANAFVVARSLKWPGAFAIAGAGKFTNIYVGDAVPYAAATYTPPMPPALQKEWLPEGADEEPEEGEPPKPQTLVEQKDLLEDPTPPEEEGEED
uniref:Radial spokehead-like protein n=1 Tax=Phaeomonas parva TaxID=124430 RepID=A0A7S1UB83_9STRA|mmetsp:Transcript_39268/g.122924  ORF Transcript_39268/g.122924 Transcript_39268/m.122924 type:complete len:456 (+) Transcript_39268:173-1540(+)|eukprot:CAMPEP_0118869144 /NCGR_PEP_ID=MMETSP1163-20130328/12595_1 /TAXON_ID=124430 /ORGANISM="Phaeomonas parva, Strain CCMP2877" /LENGTH=455 /DNA_ID=CAMNT_0006804019 /DNA_START=163 /DNA_END=1530 /DNA_ORIENTATION=-